MTYLKRNREPKGKRQLELKDKLRRKVTRDGKHRRSFDSEITSEREA